MGFIRLLTITLFLITSNLYSQVSVQIRVKQTNSKKAKLFLYRKSDIKLVDSTTQISPCLFKFNLPAGYAQGIYKLAIGKSINFDFVIADEPQISLETVVFAAEDSLKSLESKENELFIKYQNIRKKFKQQLWHLNSLIDYYPDSSSFNEILFTEFLKVKADLYWASKRLVSENPNLYTSHLILLELNPLSINGFSKVESKNNLINSWWNDVNLKDVRLVNSPELELKLWEFIKLFFDERFTKEQQDSSFISASKIVMNLNADTCIKSNFRSILFRNYIETDYDATTRYLFNESFGGLQSLKLSPEERTRYSILGKNEIGSKVFDFKIKTCDGKDIKLSKVDATHKLIFFWSMWCPHCTEMIPELFKIYHKFKNKGFEIIAICVDDDINGWQKETKEKKCDWINAIEPDNGKNKILSEYSVDGTPVLLLIDNSLKIISRPSNAKQLEVKLNQILK